MTEHKTTDTGLNDLFRRTTPGSPPDLDQRILQRAQQQAQINKKAKKPSHWAWLEQIWIRGVGTVAVACFALILVFREGGLGVDIERQPASFAGANEPALFSSEPEFSGANHAEMASESDAQDLSGFDSAPSEFPAQAAKVSTFATATAEISAGDVQPIAPVQSDADAPGTSHLSIATSSTSARGHTSSTEPTRNPSALNTFDNLMDSASLNTPISQNEVMEAAPPQQGVLPVGFDFVANGIPGLIQDLRYANSNNFVGEPIDGYNGTQAILSQPAIQALGRVQNELQPRNMGVKIFDAYRPQSAVDHFSRWALDLTRQEQKHAYYPRVEKQRLFELDYLAARSSHSRGSTVDMTLVEFNEKGQPVELDMGTPFDFFDERSWLDSNQISEEAKANREMLTKLMVRHGFQPYPKEWWHFTLVNEPYPETYFDFPVE